MIQLRAEVISIGDEITSGIRLDTNSQWISQRLGEIGIVVAFHSTVGDDLDDNVDVFRIAATRADIIVTTGGLGPTADDLTRQAIADMAGVELLKNQAVLNHIEQMYQTRGRDMPPNNEIQAWFPKGSQIINNPEGTAPGIDFAGDINESGYRIFALPGVPVEMKQMWHETVEPELKKQTGDDFVIMHHTIHCFGSGESHIETLLPNLVKRGRDPQVGITASSATISLRISTRGADESDCLEKIQPTIKTIEDCLGDLVYGENGKELQDVVVELLKSKRQTVAIVDQGLNGDVAQLISASDSENGVISTSEFSPRENEGSLVAEATRITKETKSDFGLVIGHIDRSQELVDSGQSFYQIVIFDGENSHQREVRFSGHSGWREIRAAKEVLNFFRLFLLGKV